MAEFNYSANPIGKHFDFFGKDLVVDSIEMHDTYDNFYGMDRAMQINARVSNKPRKCPTPENPFNIKRVIFNGPATIVFWNDGTKTVVKCAEEEIYNERTGIMWAIMKKAYGNSSRVNKAFNELIEGDKVASDNADYFSINPSLGSVIKNLANSMCGVKASQK